MTQQKYTISDLAAEFDISTRTIRYYEEFGLLHPERTNSGLRIYDKKDRTRLRLIIRGKRLGFSLEEIKEMIDLFDLDRTGKRQLERTIQYGNQKIAEVTERINDLLQLRDELTDLKEQFQERLAKIQKGENEP